MNIVTVAINTEAVIKEKKPSAVFLSYRRSAPLKAALFIAYLGILSKLGFFEFS